MIRDPDSFQLSVLSFRGCGLYLHDPVRLQQLGPGSRMEDWLEKEGDTGHVSFKEVATKPIYLHLVG